MRETSLLIVAHPGHELRVFQWLCQVKPRVIVLTDGAGSTGNSRLQSTLRILQDTGTDHGSLLGLFSDRELYQNIIERHFEKLFLTVATFARLLRNNAIVSVVGDAVEGHNPAHDVCRLLINAAVDAASFYRTLPLKNLDFLVVGHPGSGGRSAAVDCLAVALDETALQKKLLQSRGYPELKDEVDMALAQYGEGAFAIEYLRPVVTARQRGYLEELPPYYETYGERQVEKGLYREVIRYREHILPLMAALDVWVEEQRYRIAG